MGLLITTEDALRSEDVVSEKRKTIEAVIDNVLALPRGPQRWRGAVDMYLRLNMSSTAGMTARQEYDTVVKDNKLTRELQVNDRGTSGNKAEENMRYQLEMPAGAHYLIELVDPEAFKNIDNIDRLRRALPEFVIAEKL